MRTKRNTGGLTLAAAVLLAVGCFGGLAKAQSNLPQAPYQGKFSLPFQAHWGKAVLPAGEYQLDFASGPDSILVIRDAKTLRAVALEPIRIRDGADGEASALLIGARRDQHIVFSLRIAELGETYVFDPALAYPRKVEEARRIPVIPVLTAQK